MPFSNDQPSWNKPRFDWNKIPQNQPKRIKVFPATANAIPPSLVSTALQHETTPTNPLKAVALSELIQPLSDALKQSQVWLEDFANEKVILSSDLYEILTVFSKLQKHSVEKTKQNPDPPATPQQ